MVVDGAPVFGRRSVEFSVGINVLTSIYAKFLGKTYHFGCRVAYKTGILRAIKTRKAGNAGGQRVWRRFLGEI